MGKTIPLAERFWAKVDTSAGPEACWPWTGSKSREYGYIKVLGKNTPAHRVAYKLQNGEIPEGLDVLHTCDNSLCQNGAHLFTGTALDNVKDCMQKGRRASKVGPLNGRYIDGRTLK